MAVGRVVSAKNLKTVTVLVETTKMHPLYKKSYKASKKYQVHDELGAKEGDIVRFIPCAPVSKHKHWKVMKILGTDEVALGTEHLKESAQEAIEEVLPEEEKVEKEQKIEKAVEEGKESK